MKKNPDLPTTATLRAGSQSKTKSNGLGTANISENAQSVVTDNKVIIPANKAGHYNNNERKADGLSGLPYRT